MALHDLPKEAFARANLAGESSTGNILILTVGKLVSGCAHKFRVVVVRLHFFMFYLLNLRGEYTAFGTDFADILRAVSRTQNMKKA